MHAVSDAQYNGQILQDKFVLSVLKHKRNGTFLELGANDPRTISNTYLLESMYGWKGIMVEYDQKFREPYLTHRPNSYHAFQDATAVDYAALLTNLQYPTAIDYLQIDLEPGNGSTLQALKHLNNTVFDTHKFAVVTFEHDIYYNQPIYHSTRNESRRIFDERGYVRVFKDVCNDGWWNNEEVRERIRAGNKETQRDTGTKYPFEDWYVHPDLVDMTYVNSLIANHADKYVPHGVCGSVINFTSFDY